MKPERKGRPAERPRARAYEPRPMFRVSYRLRGQGQVRYTFGYYEKASRAQAMVKVCKGQWSGATDVRVNPTTV